MPKEIKPNSIWKHNTGRIYTVLLVANEHTTGTTRMMYPHTVVYQSSDGRIWAKNRKVFLGSMVEHKEQAE